MTARYNSQTMKHKVGDRVQTAQTARRAMRGTVVGFHDGRGDAARRCYVVRWDRDGIGTGWCDYTLRTA